LTGSNNEEITTTTMITKTAKTDHPINGLIAKRSVRAFSTWLVEKSKLLSILEAARWAPTIDLLCGIKYEIKMTIRLNMIL
jgi:hypothetical protein